METDDRVVQKIYVIWYRFCILGKCFARPFEVKGLPFPLSCFSEDEKYFFWFQTMENDWVWRKFFERFITILNVSVDIVGVFFSTSINIL